MRIVVDTNVFVSGIFFKGPPYEILNAWRRGFVQIILSPEILEEYRRVGDELSLKFASIELQPMWDLLTAAAVLCNPPPLPEPVCSGSDDDKFLACALVSRTRLLISGDRALLRVSGFRGITILTPRNFMEKYLQNKR
jgi:putative PIN family toxin of toxin-antitoxin system